MIDTLVTVEDLKVYLVLKGKSKEVRLTLDPTENIGDLVLVNQPTIERIGLGPRITYYPVNPIYLGLLDEWFETLMLTKEFKDGGYSLSSCMNIGISKLKAVCKGGGELPQTLFNTISRSLVNIVSTPPKYLMYRANGTRRGKY